MRVFITDLAAYNQGHLVGEWVELPMEEAELGYKVMEIFAKGEEITGDTDHEEYFITDWESKVDNIIHEYSDVYKLNEQAETLESLDDADKKKVNYLMDYTGCTFEEALEHYQDVKVYEDTTLEDLAYQFVDEGIFGEINPTIANYIDYEAIARDLGFDYVEVNNDLFRSA